MNTLYGEINQNSINNSHPSVYRKQGLPKISISI